MERWEDWECMCVVRQTLLNNPLLFGVRRSTQKGSVNRIRSVVDRLEG